MNGKDPSPAVPFGDKYSIGNSFFQRSVVDAKIRRPFAKRLRVLRPSFRCIWRLGNDRGFRVVFGSGGGLRYVVA